MNAPVIGRPLTRVDGRAKVTGAARYAAEFNQAGQAHAVIVSSTVGRGRVKRIGVAPVLRLPGVIAVISYLNAPRLAYRPHKGPIDPAIGERLHGQSARALTYWWCGMSGALSHVKVPDLSRVLAGRGRRRTAAHRRGREGIGGGGLHELLLTR